jgi:predicted permease
VLEVQPGFNSDHIVTAKVWLPVPNDPKNNPYPTQEKRNVFLASVIQRLSAVPGVREVAIGGGNTPFAGLRNANAFDIQGRTVAAGEGPTAELGVTTANTFQALGIPLVRGRMLADNDDPKGEPVVVIDETAWERFWPNSDPVGKQIRLQVGIKQPWRRIVGVVGRSRSDGLDAPYTPHIFLPARQLPINAMTVYIQTEATPEALESVIRHEIQAVDPDLPVFGVRSLRSSIAASLAARRFAMQLLGFFAGTALLLAALGIYGVMAYFVSQRTGEIGVRMALGAQRRDVLKLIVRQGMGFALAGVAIGFIVSLALARLISGLLFGVSPNDPFTLALFTMLLAGVALLANYVPARRAAMVAPMTALRND